MLGKIKGQKTSKKKKRQRQIMKRLEVGKQLPVKLFKAFCAKTYDVGAAIKVLDKMISRRFSLKDAMHEQELFMSIRVCIDMF